MLVKQTNQLILYILVFSVFWGIKQNINNLKVLCPLFLSNEKVINNCMRVVEKSTGRPRGVHFDFFFFREFLDEFFFSSEWFQTFVLSKKNSLVKDGRSGSLLL